MEHETKNIVLNISDNTFMRRKSMSIDGKIVLAECNEPRLGTIVYTYDDSVDDEDAIEIILERWEEDIKGYDGRFYSKIEKTDVRFEICKYENSIYVIKLFLNWCVKDAPKYEITRFDMTSDNIDEPTKLQRQNRLITISLT
uniref:Uncharacterized protein n=1 Tax=viral metagenome TaxID=1070528 RepID=A0A6C0EGS0_9ZZZZ